MAYLKNCSTKKTAGVSAAPADRQIPTPAVSFPGWKVLAGQSLTQARRFIERLKASAFKMGGCS
jgi:hypothetical protein